MDATTFPYFPQVSHVIRQGQVAKDLQLQPASDFEYSKVPNWTRHTWAIQGVGPEAQWLVTWCSMPQCHQVDITAFDYIKN